ncbi:MAG TPA: hypothetical protein VGN12_30030 [Pirellulales bacterium]|jgi:hypothetical protein
MKSFLRNAAVYVTDKALLNLALRAYDNRSARARKHLAQYAPDVQEYMKLRLSRGAADHTFLAWKLLELIYQLERIRPQSIVEFGSGITTYIFARYAARHNASIVTVDETPEWQQVVRSELPDQLRKLVQWEQRKSCSEVQESGQVVFYEQGYSASLPKTIDLAYVDGPTCLDIGGKKTPCIDVPKLLASGHVVRNVLYDYRLDSADYLLDAPVGLRYDGDLFYELQYKRSGCAMGLTDRHHTHLYQRTEEVGAGAKTETSDAASVSAEPAAR